MVEINNIIAFSLIALGMVLTPGPNMIYLISRSICQGWLAGFISLGGVVLGFIIYMISASFGLTTLFMAVPYAYDTLRFAGAAYLLYLAWQCFKPNGRSFFEVKNLPKDSHLKLFSMGFFTSLLNPKIALMYLSLFPQFIAPEHGNVLMQSLTLGTIQIIISATFNSLFVILAGSIALFLSQNQKWLILQRWLMGTVLAGLAIKLATEAKR